MNPIEYATECHFICSFVFYSFMCAKKNYSKQSWLTVVTQNFYMTEAENEYVIKGNAAVMKCKIPSFVADFVYVDAWINVEDGTELTAPNTNTNDSSASYGYFCFANYLPPFISVLSLCA